MKVLFQVEAKRPSAHEPVEATESKLFASPAFSEMGSRHDGAASGGKQLRRLEHTRGTEMQRTGHVTCQGKFCLAGHDAGLPHA